VISKEKIKKLWRISNGKDFIPFDEKELLEN
jgi:hypothetical protein